MQTDEKNVLIVSNRLPVVVERQKDGLYFKQAMGGLATGLGPFYEKHGGAWIGWPGIYPEDEAERNDIVTTLEGEMGYEPVFLNKNEIKKYYLGFSNRTVWPLFHYFPQYAVYDQSEWREYKKVNEKFASKVLDLMDDQQRVWIHDYHLMLLPNLIRKERPDATIGFFLHIPFPSMEIFRLLPWRDEILDGLLGADLVGFHTYGYVRHFISSVHRLRGHDHRMGKITTGQRTVKADVFPIGISVSDFLEKREEQRTKDEAEQFLKKVADRKIIFSIDRLDYSKGIPQRLKGYLRFLKKYPQWHDKVTFIMVGVPSRTKVEQYKKLRKKVDQLVGQINGTCSTPGWVPIWYMYRSVPFHTLVSFYSIADIGLITPLRDGMNLVAKEYVVTRREGKGVLILSEMAGAASELNEALIVNPNNEDEIADAIHQALQMDTKEKNRRFEAMRRRIRKFDVYKWGESFLTELLKTKGEQYELREKRLNQPEVEKILAAYNNSKKRLLFLDYDGTLVPFQADPVDARPEKELLDTLGGLCRDKNNSVVLVSGRDKDTLAGWFKDINVCLVAEHGAWIYEPEEGQWYTPQRLSSEWKGTIRPIIQSFVERVPGSFLEEKDFSLAWHYRKVNRDLGKAKAMEIMDILKAYLTNLQLQVIQGKKVIEVRNLEVNKGMAVNRWLEKKNWDFILALGDDHTDEDTFGALPASAYSIKVGASPSKARYFIENPKKTVSMLESLGTGR